MNSTPISLLFYGNPTKISILSCIFKVRDFLKIHCYYLELQQSLTIANFYNFLYEPCLQASNFHFTLLPRKKTCSRRFTFSKIYNFNEIFWKIIPNFIVFPDSPPQIDRQSSIRPLKPATIPVQSPSFLCANCQYVWFSQEKWQFNFGRDSLYFNQFW